SAAGRDGADLHAVTGGNPFYVTEVLASEGAAVPTSVRDAVLARAARLTAPARGVLDVVAVVPGRTERWLLDEVLAPGLDEVDECVRAGALRSTRDALSFRHELARRAWEDAIEPGRAAALHARVLEALGAGGGERTMLARLVHHADRAGDGAAVLRHAPAAAREAASVGAHREAALHYETALRRAAAVPPVERAALVEGWTDEVHHGGRIAEAVHPREEALQIWAAAGDRRREGDALRWLSRLAWFEGRRDDAAACLTRAIEVLEPLGPCHELAMAYSTRAQLFILAEKRGPASEWGDRAVAMAEQLGDIEALVHALTNTACLDPGTSRENQLRAVRLAQEHGLHEHALRAYTWLVSDCIEERDYANGGRFVEDAIRYATDRDIDTFADYLRGWRARLCLEQGRWVEAEADAADVLRREGRAAVLRLPSLPVLGLLRVRRGEAGGEELLDEALDCALATGEIQRLRPAAAARAEAAWLRGDDAAVRAEAMRVYPLALELDNAWAMGDLACWLRRAGALEEPPARAAEPYALELAGRWRQAAAAWEH